MVCGVFMITGLGKYWREKISSVNISEKVNDEADSQIMIGIILGGILFVYLIFIGFQINTLFVHNLPSELSDVTSLVKSGFWQLIVLTILNVIFYVGTFRSTKIIQGILSVFAVASLLLVISAGHKVWMYITSYGLSFEKFFASYTVIFCALVFIWFIFLLFKKNKKEVNIIKTLMFAALWMYSITTIIPLEKIIFTTNLKLTQKENSKVDINELKMLGFDALEIIEENKEVLIKEAIKDSRFSVDNYPVVKKENTNSDLEKERYVNYKWNLWFNEEIKTQNVYNINYWKENIPNEKRRKWYEKTFKENFYKPKHIVIIDNKLEFLNTSEIKSKTFKNSSLGFEFDNPKSLRISFNDFSTLEDNKNNNLYVTVHNKALYKDDEKYLSISFYSKFNKDNEDEKIIKLVKECEESNCLELKFKNFVDNTIPN